MTTKEVLEAVAAMPSEEWVKIQVGIAELIAGSLAEAEASDIEQALAQSEAQFARGQTLSLGQLRERFGVK